MARTAGHGRGPVKAGPCAPLTGVPGTHEVICGEGWSHRRDPGLPQPRAHLWLELFVLQDGLQRWWELQEGPPSSPACVRLWLEFPVCEVVCRDNRSCSRALFVFKKKLSQSPQHLAAFSVWTINRIHGLKHHSPRPDLGSTSLISDTCFLYFEPL